MEKNIGYVLIGLALFVGGYMVNTTRPADKIKRDNVPEIVILKPFRGDCPKGSSRIPDAEIKKFFFVSHCQSINRDEFGRSFVHIMGETDWDIDFVQVWFEIKYANGTSRQRILANKEIVFRSKSSISFIVSEEDKVAYFTDFKEFNYRVVDACGKIRPMKIEIKAKEALKEAGESINKVIKGIDDLFSR